jgi:outer membrane protein TolC
MGTDGPAEVDILDTEARSPAAAPLPPLEELVAFAYEHRPELKAQQAEVRAREEEVRRLRGERLPSMTITTGYLFGESSQRPLDTQAFNTQWRAVAEVKGPLFDFGRTSQKVGVALAQVAEAAQKVTSLKVTIAAEVQETYARIADTQGLLTLLDKEIEQATEACEARSGPVRATVDPVILPR